MIQEVCVWLFLHKYTVTTVGQYWAACQEQWVACTAVLL